MTDMGLRILFVEKDKAMADRLVPNLERNGHQVSVARTRRQAMGRIRSLPPDLLLMDVASFGARGYGIVDALRAILNRVPAILMLEKEHNGAGDWADELMTPPFTARKVLQRVRKLAERVDDRGIRAGHLLLDPDTRTLYKGKTACHLRPKEVALLAYMMRNPDRVLSRAEIFRQVWETDYLGDTRTLTVYIRWLRQKIEEDPNAPCLLHTVRRRGYRFEVADSDQ